MMCDLITLYTNSLNTFYEEKKNKNLSLRRHV